MRGQRADSDEIEAFHDLFMELVFDEGEGHDRPETLIDDVTAPPEAAPAHRRRFAVGLVARLLFVRRLEDVGVLDDGLLRARRDAHGPNGLYDTEIEPLLHDLLATPRDDRPVEMQGGWREEVPCLTTDLFGEVVPNERAYGVDGPALSVIIDDLVYRGDGQLRAAVLGSVLELTINHIGGELGTQKDVGAYYTPPDITEMVLDRTVRARIRDALTDAWAEHSSAPDDVIASHIDDLGVDSAIEAAETASTTSVDGDTIDFGNHDAVDDAADRVASLTVLDPACGSGHFLVAAHAELYRVWRRLTEVSGEVDAREAATTRAAIASDCIYGVDVDPAAAEIARLRLLLASVGDGWREEWGKVPLPDGIVTGNALVGLPLPEGQHGSRLLTDNWGEVAAGGAKAYATSLDHTFEDTIATPDRARDVFECVPGDTLHPEVESVRVRREDGEEFTQPDEERLEEAGFRVHTKSARLNIASRHAEIREKEGIGNAESRERIVDALVEIAGSRFELAEVIRQPVGTDLDAITGEPLHWPDAFSAVADRDGCAFDVIVGNPPYGDLLAGAEAGIVEGYRTGGVNEVAVPFVERQLQLLAEDGVFGNVTTTAVVNRSDLGEFHDLLREELADIEITALARRPSKPFPGAEINVAVVTGHDGDTERGELRTSDFVRFDSSDREERLSDPPHSRVDGLHLREDIGGERDGFQLVPKVGGDDKRRVLERLAAQPARLEDWRGDGDELHYRRAANYWMNVVRGDPPDEATNMRSLVLDGELRRDFGFLVLNSSLFYLYWITYGNLHDVTAGRVRRFPVPAEDELVERAGEISAAANRLDRAIDEHYHPDSYHQFRMGEVKPVTDDIEEIVGECYGLSKADVDFLCGYHTDYGRGEE